MPQRRAWNAPRETIGVTNIERLACGSARRESRTKNAPGARTGAFFALEASC